ncbi:hypothetical protein NDU88_008139 [Pleurodeles waltl]|uniref:Uncharacterized protein n=1 Tax=Pleurodeles waltl TaxID=8319 RepID=A0AAV7SUH2_PLEWA|nr:hypothetical protein NDU88_008139 [Pleurodeles waltl]
MMGSDRARWYPGDPGDVALIGDLHLWWQDQDLQDLRTGVEDLVLDLCCDLLLVCDLELHEGVVSLGNLEFVGDPRELASAKRARGVLGHGVGFRDGVRGGDREGKYVLEFCESALSGTDQFLTISSLWLHAEE